MKYRSKPASVQLALAIISLNDKNYNLLKKLLKVDYWRIEKHQEASCIAQQLYVENLLGE